MTEMAAILPKSDAALFSRRTKPTRIPMRTPTAMIPCAITLSGSRPSAMIGIVSMLIAIPIAIMEPTPLIMVALSLDRSFAAITMPYTSTITAPIPCATVLNFIEPRIATEIDISITAIDRAVKAAMTEANCFLSTFISEIEVRATSKTLVRTPMARAPWISLAVGIIASRNSEPARIPTEIAISRSALALITSCMDFRALVRELNTPLIDSPIFPNLSNMPLNESVVFVNPLSIV